MVKEISETFTKEHIERWINACNTSQCSIMSKKLLLQQANMEALQNEEDEKELTPIKDIDAEIECPRCYDIMIFSSDFDRLGYFCDECKLSLFIN